MDTERCEQCGQDFDGPGVDFRNHTFCSDTCCETFEERLVLNGEPAEVDLAEDFGDEDFEDADFEAADPDDFDDDYAGFEQDGY